MYTLPIATFLTGNLPDYPKLNINHLKSVNYLKSEVVLGFLEVKPGDIFRLLFLPALACRELSTGPPHRLAGLDLHGGARRGARKLLSGRRLLGDLLDQSAHPLLLLLLGHGQQQQVLGRGNVVVHWRGENIINILFCFFKRYPVWSCIDYNEHKLFPTFAWGDDLLLLVHVVLVALDVAAPTLQGRRRLEHVPQRLGARLTVGGEVVERGDELVAFVADVAGLLPDGQWVHGKLGLLLALAFVSVKNLER